MDIFTFRPKQIRKLFTLEDTFGIHKTLGILAMGHYFYRMHEWYVYGHMRFDDSWYTLGWIFVHLGLSTSSLIFHIPNVRNRSGPMIWPEFRLHSILFAMRSLSIMIYHWIGLTHTQHYDPRPLIVTLTMVLADKVTNAYPVQGSTMRTMPFPNYVSESFKRRINLFYSMSQVYATMAVLASPMFSHVFMILFPIQLAAFLMTCVRKSIITPAGWHFWYTVSLLTTFIHNGFNNEAPRWTAAQIAVHHGSVIYFMIRRFKYHHDKYALWLHIMLALKLVKFSK